MGKRNRGERVLQQRRGRWERRRVQGEADHCHESRSATPLRFGHDAAPPGAASRGLRSGGRGASERSGGCLSRYSSEAECWEQAQLRGPTRVGELQSSAEAVDLLMRGRVASAGDVLIQRNRAVEAASLEEGGWSVARHLEVLPEAAVSTMSSGLRGVVVKAERARLRLRQGQWKRSRERRKSGLSPSTSVGGARSMKKNPSRSAKRPGGRNMGEREERPPEGSAVEQPGPRRSERPEQGTAKQVAVAGEVAPLVVCGASRGASWQRGTWAGLPPTASTWGGPGAPMIIRAGGFSFVCVKLGPWQSRAAVVRVLG